MQRIEQAALILESGDKKLLLTTTALGQLGLVTTECGHSVRDNALDRLYELAGIDGSDHIRYTGRYDDYTNFGQSGLVLTHVWHGTLELNATLYPRSERAAFYSPSSLTYGALTPLAREVVSSLAYR